MVFEGNCPADVEGYLQHLMRVWTLPYPLLCFSLVNHGAGMPEELTLFKGFYGEVETAVCVGKKLHVILLILFPPLGSQQCYWQLIPVLFECIMEVLIKIVSKYYTKISSSCPVSSNFTKIPLCQNFFPLPPPFPSHTATPSRHPDNKIHRTQWTTNGLVISCVLHYNLVFLCTVFFLFQALQLYVECNV